MATENIEKAGDQVFGSINERGLSELQAFMDKNLKSDGVIQVKTEEFGEFGKSFDNEAFKAWAAKYEIPPENIPNIGIPAPSAIGDETVNHTISDEGISQHAMRGGTLVELAENANKIERKERDSSVTDKNINAYIDRQIEEAPTVEQQALLSTSLDEETVKHQINSGMDIEENGKPVFSNLGILKTHELPNDLQKKFIVSDEAAGKFFFHNDKSLAFADRGKKLVTSNNKPEVIQSMLSLAKEKNWSSIKLSGSPEFKSEAWLQAKLEGIEVTGFTPKPEDIARFDQMQNERLQNGMQSVIATQSQASREKSSEAPSKTPGEPQNKKTKPIIPKDYKPSADAIAGTQHLRDEGIDDRKVRAVMYGIDMTNKKALELGMNPFQARIFDAEAKPQKLAGAHSISIEKTKPKEINQPAPSLKR